ncbi:MAG: DUF2029 domain-containing protein [Clostridia bacterium]|nr:DUF2029 domain-containing protein [Clostridia bacterium]
MTEATTCDNLSQLKSNSAKKRFSYVILLSIALTCVALFINSEKTLMNIFFSNNVVFFSDFSDSIYDSMFKDPYVERGVIYPAFIYVFYRIIGSIIPTDVIVGGTYSIRDSYYGQLLFQAYNFLVFIALFCSIIRIMQSKDKTNKVFALALVLSSPVLYAYQRGNSIILSLVFLLLFFGYKNSEKMYQREFALVFLSIAANIKLYPAVFGIMLLADRKFVQALRCMIYGIILFVLPFFFFGGLKDIYVMFVNILRTGGVFSTQYGYQVGIRHLLSYIAAVTSRPEIVARTRAVTVIVLMLLLIIVFFSKKYFRKVLALGLMCTLIPGFSWIYTTVYMIPAVIYYYMDRSYHKKNYIYPFCFLLLLCQFPIDVSAILPVVKKPEFFSLIYNMTLSTVLSNIALWVLLIVSFADTVFEYTNRIFGYNIRSKS